MSWLRYAIFPLQSEDIGLTETRSGGFMIAIWLINHFSFFHGFQYIHIHDGFQFNFHGRCSLGDSWTQYTLFIKRKSLVQLWDWLISWFHWTRWVAFKYTICMSTIPWRWVTWAGKWGHVLGRSDWDFVYSWRCSIIFKIQKDFFIFNMWYWTLF